MVAKKCAGKRAPTCLETAAFGCCDGSVPLDVERSLHHLMVLLHVLAQTRLRVYGVHADEDTVSLPSFP